MLWLPHRDSLSLWVCLGAAHKTNTETRRPGSNKRDRRIKDKDEGEL